MENIVIKKGCLTIVNYKDNTSLKNLIDPEVVGFEGEKKQFHVSPKGIRFKGLVRDYLDLMILKSASNKTISKYIEILGLKTNVSSIENLSSLKKRYLDSISAISSGSNIYVLVNPLDELTLFEQTELLNFYHSLTFKGIAVVIITKHHIYPEYDNVIIFEVDRSIELMERNDKDSYKLEVKDSKGNIVFLDYSEIVFIESTSGIALVHTNSTHFVSNFKMYEFESLLLPHGFMRVHKSYIVNKNQIKGFKTLSTNLYELVLESNEFSVPLSRNKVSDVRRMMLND